VDCLNPTRFAIRFGSYVAYAFLGNCLSHYDIEHVRYFSIGSVVGNGERTAHSLWLLWISKRVGHWLEVDLMGLLFAAGVVVLLVVVAPAIQTARYCTKFLEER
jgi:hypothetical protein